MQNKSHDSAEQPTWIATIRDSVEVWRKQQGWSRETAAQMIVDAHERHGLHQVSGIVFDPPTRDAFSRMKVNADRIFRWLDEVTKDNNLLPANFILSILIALPPDLRMHCLDDMLRPLSIGIRQIGESDRQGLNAIGLLRTMLAENSDAQQAVAALVDGASMEELLKAQRELAESSEATQRALAAVEAALVEAEGRQE